MASEAELTQSAVKHAKATSKTWDWYLNEIRSNPDYAYKNTEWYRAGGDLEKVARPGSAPSPPPVPPPSTTLASVQARIFLADSPLDSLAAPAWMVPVCTADAAYRYWYDDDAIYKLGAYFGTVEVWCDCRAEHGTSYAQAEEMVRSLGLDGPAWGQCETRAEFEHGYDSGARRMVGQLADLTADQKKHIETGEVLLAFELYRNKMPWQVPDYETCAPGIGGNCIGCYESATEAAVYVPVSEYRSLGYYVPRRDSVYGVGLQAADWAALG